MTSPESLDVAIDPASTTPPYEQIRAQVAALVHRGTLAHGDRLPSVRALATELGVAAGTVARAYTELETDGLVAGRGRLGTLVTGVPGDAATLQLQAATNRLVAAARADGLDDAAVRAAVETALGGAAPA